MLPDRNGRVTKTQEELQGVIQEHFENFLRGEPESRAPDWQSRWNQFTNVPRRIQWRQRKALDKKLTLQDLEDALQVLPNGKSPGRDGFQKEFFTWGWEFIKPVLNTAVEQMWQEGSMGTKLNESLITLLPKPRANEGVQFWRPISLLSTIYKIIAKALARRIAPLLDQWISKQQRGFIKGRCILDNILFVRELKWWAHKNKVPVILLSLDFEKAYDAVRWECVIEVLCKFGFGEDFIKWIHILLKDACASVLVNGRVTRRSRLGKSVRQGDPLPPALFIMITDLLIRKIKGDPRILGVTDLEGLAEELSLYADDTLLALLAEELSVRTASDVIEEFSWLLGCRINWSKSNMICLNLGATPGYVSHIPKVAADASIPHLGLPLCEGEENGVIGRMVVIKLIKKARFFSVMELTLPGRVIVIYHILHATLWYFLFAWAPSEADMKNLRRVVLNFLWGKDLDAEQPCHKVAWSHLIQHKRLGGHGLVDPVKKAQVLQGQWVVKALSPSDYPRRGYILKRLKSVRAVKDGPKSVAHLFSNKPNLENWMGSPLWRAIWSGWETLRPLLKFLPPGSRDEAAFLRL